ncbi:hypothetical protein HDU97_001588 [Phlyctochytrium planicorne]|nr:hypothetical protein HDU97_001588 [Phlyctochytrium planicorne]
MSRSSSYSLDMEVRTLSRSKSNVVLSRQCEETVSDAADVAPENSRSLRHLKSTPELGSASTSGSNYFSPPPFLRARRKFSSSTVASATSPTTPTSAASTLTVTLETVLENVVPSESMGDAVISMQGGQELEKDVGVITIAPSKDNVEQATNVEASFAEEIQVSDSSEEAKDDERDINSGHSSNAIFSDDEPVVTLAELETIWKADYIPQSNARGGIDTATTAVQEIESIRRESEDGNMDTGFDGDDEHDDRMSFSVDTVPSTSTPSLNGSTDGDAVPLPVGESQEPTLRSETTPEDIVRALEAELAAALEARCISNLEPVSVPTLVVASHDGFETPINTDSDEGIITLDELRLMMSPRTALVEAGNALVSPQPTSQQYLLPKHVSEVDVPITVDREVPARVIETEVSAKAVASEGFESLILEQVVTVPLTVMSAEPQALEESVSVNLKTISGGFEEILSQEVTIPTKVVLAPQPTSAPEVSVSFKAQALAFKSGQASQEVSFPLTLAHIPQTFERSEAANEVVVPLSTTFIGLPENVLTEVYIPFRAFNMYYGEPLQTEVHIGIQTQNMQGFAGSVWETPIAMRQESVAAPVSLDSKQVSVAILARNQEVLPETVVIEKATVYSAVAVPHLEPPVLDIPHPMTTKRSSSASSLQASIAKGLSMFSSPHRQVHETAPHPRKDESAASDLVMLDMDDLNLSAPSWPGSPVASRGLTESDGSDDAIALPEPVAKSEAVEMQKPAVKVRMIPEAEEGEVAMIDIDDVETEETDGLADDDEIQSLPPPSPAKLADMQKELVVVEEPIPVVYLTEITEVYDAPLEPPSSVETIDSEESDISTLEVPSGDIHEESLDITRQISGDEDIPALTPVSTESLSESIAKEIPRPKSMQELATELTEEVIPPAAEDTVSKAVEDAPIIDEASETVLNTQLTDESLHPTERTEADFSMLMDEDITMDQREFASALESSKLEVSFTPPGLLQSSGSVAIEMVTGILKDSGAVSLDIIAHIQNVAFDKDMAVLYSIDGWKTSTWSKSGMYIGPSGIFQGWDRFQATFEVIVAGISSISVEFVAKCVMAGTDYWDNNNGNNYKVNLEISMSQQPQAVEQTENSLKQTPNSMILKEVEEEISAHVERNNQAAEIPCNDSEVDAENAQSTQVLTETEIDSSVEAFEPIEVLEVGEELEVSFEPSFQNEVTEIAATSKDDGSADPYCEDCVPLIAPAAEETHVFNLTGKAPVLSVLPEVQVDNTTRELSEDIPATEESTVASAMVSEPTIIDVDDNSTEVYRSLPIIKEAVSMRIEEERASSAEDGCTFPATELVEATFEIIVTEIPVEDIRVDMPVDFIHSDEALGETHLASADEAAVVAQESVTIESLTAPLTEVEADTGSEQLGEDDRSEVDITATPTAEASAVAGVADVDVLDGRKTSSPEEFQVLDERHTNRDTASPDSFEESEEERKVRPDSGVWVSSQSSRAPTALGSIAEDIEIEADSEVEKNVVVTPTPIIVIHPPEDGPRSANDSGFGTPVDKAENILWGRRGSLESIPEAHEDPAFDSDGYEVWDRRVPSEQLLELVPEKGLPPAPEPVIIERSRDLPILNEPKLVLSEEPSVAAEQAQVKAHDAIKIPEGVVDGNDIEFASAVEDETESFPDVKIGPSDEASLGLGDIQEIKTAKSTKQAWVPLVTYIIRNICMAAFVMHFFAQAGKSSLAAWEKFVLLTASAVDPFMVGHLLIVGVVLVWAVEGLRGRFLKKSLSLLSPPSK